MTSYYSALTFLRFFTAAGLLILLLWTDRASGGSLRVPARLFSLCAVSGIIAWALIPVCPFPRIREGLRLVWPILAFLSLGLFLRLRIFRRQDREASILDRYGAQIADHMRESLVIFSPSLRVISSGRKDAFGSLFPPGARFGEPRQDLPGELTAILAGRQDSRGECDLAGRRVRYRFLALPRGAGFLLRISDITRERELIRILEVKESVLIRRQRILEDLERGDRRGSERELGRDIAGRVETLVEERLTGLTAALEREAPLEELITAAEESMSAIRQAVTELSPERSLV